MIVNVSSPTHFHVLDLARQLERQGVLGKYFTALPPSRTQGLESDHVSRNLIPLLPLFLARNFPETAIQRNLLKTHRDLFSNWLTNSVTPCDVFHCLSGFGINAHRRAKNNFGALTVCDRGSSHIVFQEKILQEEYRIWDQSFPGINKKAIETELQEYEFCDLITVPSSFAYNSFLKMGVPSERIAKIPYGVDLSIFKRHPKQDNIFRILFVGNLCFRKGIPYLLQALNNINLPNLEITLIGPISPEVKPFLNKFAGNLKYLGVKPKSELPFFYSQASVFVLPSIEEGLALVQAQAMACGLPVISTINAGAEDLFTNGKEGFILPIRDPDAIREKVLLLYENNLLRQQMSNAALKRVQSLGGWSFYGQKIVDCYRAHLKDKDN